MRWLSLFAILGFVASPFVVHAAGDLFADSLVATGPNLLTPSNALGAPDGAYADFLDDDAYMTLDMGDEVTGDLTLTMYLLNVGASYTITFYDAAYIVLDTASAQFTPGVTSSVAIYEGSEPYRFIRIATTDTEEWRLDAVTAAALAVTEDEAADEEVPAEDDVVDEEIPSYTVGSLLKTDESAAVYILGADGYRHAFPSESVFASWGLSFDDVVVVDAATMASYMLGRNVTVRSGTHLVKVQTDPKVYAVEPGGVLRWVTSEAIALQLYGADWAERVVDVSDAFWGNYTVGEAIDSAVHPDGSVLEATNGVRWYVVDGTKGELSDAQAEDYRFMDDDVITGVNSTILGQYAEMSADVLMDGAQWPF